MKEPPPCQNCSGCGVSKENLTQFIPAREFIPFQHKMFLFLSQTPRLKHNQLTLARSTFSAEFQIPVFSLLQPISVFEGARPVGRNMPKVLGFFSLTARWISGLPRFAGSTSFYLHDGSEDSRNLRCWRRQKALVLPQKENEANRRFLLDMVANSMCVWGPRLLRLYACVVGGGQGSNQNGHRESCLAWHSWSPVQHIQTHTHTHTHTHANTPSTHMHIQISHWSLIVRGVTARVHTGNTHISWGALTSWPVDTWWSRWRVRCAPCTLVPTSMPGYQHLVMYHTWCIPWDI